MDHTHQQVGVAVPRPVIDSTDNPVRVKALRAEAEAADFANAGLGRPVGARQDLITIGGFTAARISLVPANAKKRWAHSAIMIEIETGRDYRILGGTEWFEIPDGVVFTVQRTATVVWAEGTMKIEAGLWLVRLA